MVLDTHVWVGLVTGTPALSSEFARSLEELKSPLRISAITIREVLLLLRSGRIRSKLSPAETVSEWLAAYEILVVPINVDIMVASCVLNFSHKDPADQIIAATAFNLGVPLATADRELGDLPWLETVSPF